MTNYDYDVLNEIHFMGISANDDGALYSANKNDDKYHTFQDPIQLCQTMTMDRFKAAKSNAGIHQ
jgi:hypothetical protein